MSSLLDAVLSSSNGDVVEQLARQFGTDSGQTRDALAQLTKVLGANMSNGARSSDGLGSLIGALQRGNHADYLDDLSQLSRPETRADGNAILGHVLGSKDASREVASRVGGNTGIDPAIVKQMLPIVATLVMGMLSKRQQTGALPRQASAAAPATSPLTALLDANRDGSIADDLANLAGKFLR
jgi:hypothetical protein